jgi:hypothetical protein
MAIEVTGKLATDGETWCLDVTEEEYRRVMGENAYQTEKAYRDDPDLCYKQGVPWRLYIDDLLKALGVLDADRISLTIDARSP